MAKDVRAGVNEVHRQAQTGAGAQRDFDDVSKVDERHRYTVPVRLLVSSSQTLSALCRNNTVVEVCSMLTLTASIMDVRLTCL